ncbi:hypothetical protein MGYG_00906 [Nannizzia gypsea CBS 118893]|uniref:Uncharacterized protein n=1 Tax=Arthroderma gypseum (strain ATCC MYA-4604 / CBS 118893) TaxID=535722 RepID=E5R2U7_ARTGP|nr:hypothetical protein MGYG_00906 [Nannizzia gypsea CBS 118893]EFQ97868.1 hypothetical protein MGYG_00906 [Nannizzia gypsea CBS 118893]
MPVTHEPCGINLKNGEQLHTYEEDWDGRFDDGDADAARCVYSSEISTTAPSLTAPPRSIGTCSLVHVQGKWDPIPRNPLSTFLAPYPAPWADKRTH